MKKQVLIPASLVILLAVFAAAAYFYDQQKTQELNAAAKQKESFLVREYSPTKGNKNARVTIVEFFDPACETCRAFHPFVKQLMDDNPGKIKLVMRYAPLHHGSDYVVSMLEATKLQNKFWQTLNEMYKMQPHWAAHHNPQPQKLWLLLGEVDLDFKKVEQDMQTPGVVSNVKQDISDGRQLGVTKTPSFFVNGKPLTSFGYQQLQDLVETELQASY